MTFNLILPIIMIGGTMKNGFTLIELIMVITLLGIIALITVPAIGNSINKSKEEAYKENKKLIVNAGKQYILYCNGINSDGNSCTGIPTYIVSNTQFCVKVATLKKAGFLSKDNIKNPKYASGSSDPEKNFQFFDNGSVIVNATIQTNEKVKYSYEYSSTSSNTCI